MKESKTVKYAPEVGSRFARKTGVKVTAPNLVGFVGKLIASYNEDNLGQSTFKEYLNTVELEK